LSPRPGAAGSSIDGAGGRRSGATGLPEDLAARDAHINVLGALPAETSGRNIYNFSDAGEISDYALTALNTLVKGGIITGSNGKLDPAGTATRAQMAMVLHSLLSA
jgi:hypothetical protein